MKPLSKVTVNLGGANNQFLEALTSSTHWSDSNVASLSTVFADMFALLQNNSQYYIEFSAREGFLFKAKRVTSIFAGARFLGVKLTRRTSAATAATLTNSSEDSIYIEPYSYFDVRGNAFYNRTGVRIDAGATVNLELFEGVVRTKEFSLSGIDLELPVFNLGEPGFTVSTNDLQVTTTNITTGVEQTWKNHEGTLFDLSEFDQVFFDTTNSEGDVEIMFGDGENGMLLSSEDTLSIRYVVTKGIYGNIGLAGLKVLYNPSKYITGALTEPVLGGTGTKDPAYYKKYGSMAYKAKDTMVEFPSWKAKLMLYPGIADCTVQSQRDIAPNDPSWMNVVRVCVLPDTGGTWGGSNPNPYSAKWNELVSWIEARVGRLEIQRYNPTKVFTEIVIDVALHKGSKVEELRTAIDSQIKALFTPSAGMLGQKLALSDLDDAVKLVDGVRRPEVDYITIKSPLEDVEPDSKLEYVVPRSLILNVFHTDR